MDHKINGSIPLPLPPGFSSTTSSTSQFPKLENKKRRRNGQPLDLSLAIKSKFMEGKNERIKAKKMMKERRQNCQSALIWGRKANQKAREELKTLLPQIQNHKSGLQECRKRLNEILQTMELEPGESAEYQEFQGYIRRSMLPPPPCTRVLVEQAHELWLQLEMKTSVKEACAKTGEYMNFLDNCVRFLPKITYRNELKENRTSIKKSETEMETKEGIRKSKNSLIHLWDEDGNITDDFDKAEKKLREEKFQELLDKKERARKKPRKKNCIQEFLSEAAQLRAKEEHRQEQQQQQFHETTSSLSRTSLGPPQVQTPLPRQQSVPTTTTTTSSSNMRMSRIGPSGSTSQPLPNFPSPFLRDRESSSFMDD
jgi:hypothetical protein